MIMHRCPRSRGNIVWPFQMPSSTLPKCFSDFGDPSVFFYFWCLALTLADVLDFFFTFWTRGPYFPLRMCYICVIDDSSAPSIANGRFGGSHGPQRPRSALPVALFFRIHDRTIYDRRDLTRLCMDHAVIYSARARRQETHIMLVALATTLDLTSIFFGPGARKIHLR